MPDPYPVVTVQEEWLLDEPEEEMGSKKKFWYRQEEGGPDWLFKFPRPDSGEHWAEKIAAEVASFLGIPHARVELARFGDESGSASLSFTPSGMELVHGNQLLGWVCSDYNPDLTYGQSDHTLSSVLTVMDRMFVADDAKERSRLLIGDYLVLDALVGNTDRHHENWGIVRRRKGDGWEGRVAPSFDHASSLGRELQEQRRRRLVEETNVDKYVERGRGAIYWSESDRRGPSPLELVRRAASKHPDLCHRALTRLDRLSEDTIMEKVHRVPEDWMSGSAKQFAIAVMQYSIRQLGMIDR